MAVNVGQAAPDSALYDTDNKPRKLSDFKGRNTVLAFFPGAFTGVCTKEMCTFRDSMEKLNSLNAQVVGISVDPPFSQKAWAAANNLKFTLLSDFKREAVNTYGVAWPNLAGLEGYVAANRAVFVLDKGGVVRWKWVAEKPGTEPPYDQITAELAKLK